MAEKTRWAGGRRAGDEAVGGRAFSGQFGTVRASLEQFGAVREQFGAERDRTWKSEASAKH